MNRTASISNNFGMNSWKITGLVISSLFGTIWVFVFFARIYFRFKTNYRIVMIYGPLAINAAALFPFLGYMYYHPNPTVALVTLIAFCISIVFWTLLYSIKESVRREISNSLDSELMPNLTKFVKSKKGKKIKKGKRDKNGIDGKNDIDGIDGGKYDIFMNEFSKRKHLLEYVDNYKFHFWKMGCEGTEIDHLMDNWHKTPPELEVRYIREKIVSYKMGLDCMRNKMSEKFKKFFEQVKKSNAYKIIWI